MKKAVFTGSAVALVTPMHPDGSVNYEMLEKLVDFHLRRGTNAIVACATTGESPTLSTEESVRITQTIAKRVNGAIPVITGTGSNDTRHALELSLAAQEAGANALLMVTPYYNKTSQAGLVRHFTYVADRVGVPIILYNIPSRTGLKIQPETYLELSRHPRIAGTKDAAGDLAALAETIRLCGDDLAVYSGEDNLTLPILSIGGKGVVSTSANVIPQEMSEICRQYFLGNCAQSRRIFLGSLKMMNALFVDVNPMPVKAAMRLAGFDCGDCRLPLVSVSDGNERLIRAVMKEYGLLAGAERGGEKA